MSFLHVQICIKSLTTLPCSHSSHHWHVRKGFLRFRPSSENLNLHRRNWPYLEGHLWALSSLRHIVHLSQSKLSIWWPFCQMFCKIEGKFALSQLAPFDIGNISTLDQLFLFGTKYIQDIFCNYYSNENKDYIPREIFSLKWKIKVDNG